MGGKFEIVMCEPGGNFSRTARLPLFRSAIFFLLEDKIQLIV
jgi:hypothetical protein